MIKKVTLAVIPSGVQLLLWNPHTIMYNSSSNIDTEVEFDIITIMIIITIINMLVILRTTSTDPSPSASSGWARETSRTPRLVKGRGARRVNSSWVTSPWWTRLDSRMTIKVTKLAICGDIDDEHSWRQLSKSETLTEFCSCSCGVLGPGSPMQPAKSDLPLSGAWLSPKQSAFCCRTFYDKQYLNFLKFCAKVEKWPEGHKALKIGPVF